MQQPIRRQKLCDIAANTILARIGNGEWVGTLPSEHTLASSLNASRRVIREALTILENTGIISASQRGQRRKILKTSTNRDQLSIAILFTPFSFANDLSSQQTTRQIARRLNQEGINVITPHEGLETSNISDEALEEIFGNYDVDVWLLIRPTRQMAEFVEKHNINALCLGGDTSELEVSSIGFDGPASAYRGTRYLLERGHSRIVYPFREGRNFKDRLNASQRAMKKAFKENGVTWSHAYHSPAWKASIRGFYQMLDDYFKVTPPTAFIISSYSELVALLSYLALHRLRIGKEISVIVNHNHPELANILPGIDTFQGNDEILVQKATQALLDLARGLNVCKNMLIPQEHIVRNSVADLRG